MKQVLIPKALQEIFGERQSMASIASILLFGAILSTAVVMRFPEMYDGIPVWQRVLSFLLIFDIFCGCIANFTESTNNYYAARHKMRLLFIAVHVHIVVLALLLETDVKNAVWVWLYTIVSAFAINGLTGPRQRFVGGLLLAGGLGWVPMLPNMEPYTLIASLLFMLKVLYAFSVNHYAK